MRPAKAVFLAAVLFGAVVWVAVVPERVASAANAEAEGRKHARKANHLADTNKCKLAIPEYSKAMRLSKDPALLFNRAECYRRTGESVKAVADYRKFLVELPAAPNRSQVESQIAALDKRPAAVARAAPVVAKTPPVPRPGTPKSPPTPAAAPAPAAPFSMAAELRAEEQEQGSAPPASSASTAAPPAAPAPEPEAPLALLDTRSSPAAPADADQGSSAHWWIWVVGAVVVAGGAVGTYYALKQGKTDIPSSGLGNYKF